MLRKRRGFTLVEMLVAMALSLIIILAVTQVFRLVGDNVLAGRAVIEMSGQLRSAADQLQRDLGGLTVPVRPWPETGTGAGYFEYYEGPFWDLGLGPAAAGPEPDPRNPYPRPVPKYAESSVGDIDDVLMFTAHSTGAPFVGQVMGRKLTHPTKLDPTDPNYVHDPSNPYLFYVEYDPAHPEIRDTIESPVAEIVWFTRFNDRQNLNPDTTDDTTRRTPRPDPGEVTLHRRAFLILGTLDLSWDPDIRDLPSSDFYSCYDVSARWEWNSALNRWTKVANSLETVTLRQNRIAHNDLPLGLTDPTLLPSFPYPLSRSLLIPQGSELTWGDDGGWGAGTGVDDDGNGVANDIWEAGFFGTDDQTVPSTVTGGVNNVRYVAESYGNDVILSNLLAFDVKAYDPQVSMQRADADAVLPGDPGYPPNPLNEIGLGGYVDLFYTRYVPGFTSSFSNASNLSPLNPIVWGYTAPFSRSATYDTWTTFYEHDGVDQFNDGMMDLGTNGLDDDDANGVDDVGERETSPPYPIPLRGIQVRLRIIDRDTRQVRQMTVSSDFIPE